MRDDGVGVSSLPQRPLPTPFLMQRRVSLQTVPVEGWGMGNRVWVVLGGSCFSPSLTFPPQSFL